MNINKIDTSRVGFSKVSKTTAIAILTHCLENNIPCRLRATGSIYVEKVTATQQAAIINKFWVEE